MRKGLKRIIAGAVVATAATIALAGCVSDAHQVSENLSTEAEQFRVARDIVFYNGITDKYVAEVKGYCSVDEQSGLPGGTIAVTCRQGNGYTKDYLGKSDNVTWFMLQTDPMYVSAQHRTIVLKPLSVIPQFEGGANP
jgi:hypothetical protein